MKRVPLLLAAALAACVPAYGPRDAPRPADPSAGTSVYRKSPGVLPRSAEEISGPAVLSLLNQARDRLGQGHAEQAVAALERAQRIEPRNPFVWQQLASTHLAQSRLAEAESMAQRSNSLARGNPYIEIENWRTIGLARQALGDMAGAEEAAARITQMQETLD